MAIVLYTAAAASQLGTDFALLLKVALALLLGAALLWMYFQLRNRQPRPWGPVSFAAAVAAMILYGATLLMESFDVTSELVFLPPIILGLVWLMAPRKSLGSAPSQ